VAVADPEPGQELQVDFGRMGLLPAGERKKVCHALRPCSRRARAGTVGVTKIAILDDYIGVALEYGDWTCCPTMRRSPSTARRSRRSASSRSSPTTRSSSSPSSGRAFPGRCSKVSPTSS
jgi:hypothetical protein